MNKKNVRQAATTGVLILAATAQALIPDVTVRVIAAGTVFLCIAATFSLRAKRNCMRRVAEKPGEMHEKGDLEASLGSVVEMLHTNSQLISVLTCQLDAVIRETEAAVLNIGERFMEISSLARSQASRAASAASVALEIGRVWSPVKAEISAISGELRKSGAIMTEVRCRESELVLNEVVDTFNDVARRAQNELDGLSMQTEALANEISDIVVSMQFQDITRQKIQHVIESLKSLKTASDAMLRKLAMSPAGGNGGKTEDNIAWLEHMYTMESERETMKQALFKGTTE